MLFGTSTRLTFAPTALALNSGSWMVSTSSSRAISPNCFSGIDNGVDSNFMATCLATIGRIIPKNSSNIQSTKRSCFAHCSAWAFSFIFLDIFESDNADCARTSICGEGQSFAAASLSVTLAARLACGESQNVVKTPLPLATTWSSRWMTQCSFPAWMSNSAVD